MKACTSHTHRKTRASLYVAACVLILALLGVTKAYFTVRLELMEARIVLADVLYGAWHISGNLNTGNVERAHGIAETNLLKGMQYSIRRDIKDRNLHRVADLCFRKGFPPLDIEQHDYFTRYNARYRVWSCSRWIDSNTPLMDQVVDILYYYWPDSRRRWTTWMPRDYATNIKVGSPEEIPEAYRNMRRDNTTIEQRLEMAIEQFRNKPSD